MHALHYTNELLVRVRLSFQKLLQTRSTCRNNTKKNVWEKSNDAYSLSIRVQTTMNHISICFLPQYQRQRKCFLFFTERELKKALRNSIVNRGDWLGSPPNIKGTNKDAKIYVERSTTLHNLLFYVHTLCMGYVTNTLLLVSSSVRSKQLPCFAQGQDQKTEQ